MKLTSPSVVRKILKERGIYPRKRLGQHFLCDENVLGKIVEAAELKRQDRVLEIGAGLGTLTQAIAPRASQVIAVEVDPRLVPILEEQLAGYPNVKVIEGDILRLEWTQLLGGRPAKIMGNLPYGITSPLLERLIRHRELFTMAILLVQLEVAEKLTAPIGTRGSSSLGVVLQAYFKVGRLMRVSRNVFFPRPEVDAALIKLSPFKAPRFQAPEGLFLDVVHAAFGMRRKTILRALALSPRLKLTADEARRLLERAGIEEGRRGETLKLEELDRLAKALYGLERHSSSRRSRS